MATLTDLPGTSESVEADIVHSRTAALQSLRAGRAATASGDRGAINIWIDNDGLYRCAFMRFRATKDSRSFRFIAAVDSWLRAWFPKMSS